MKYVITENQSQNLLSQSVSKIGWMSTSKMVGGDENLAKMGFDNDYTKFLDLYTDMNVRKVKSTLWIYELNNNNIMFHHKRKKDVWIDWSSIIHPFIEGFNLSNRKEIRDILEKWLFDNYKIKFEKIGFHPISQGL
jgi:hypothetical protein